uniref:AzlC family ABC transporter permease n=1 Tax=Pseudomonas veronii TaxID=76761 RepID=UPI003C7BAE1F
MNTESVRSETWRGIKDAFPLMFAVAPYALVLGAQAAQVNLSSVEVALMTGLNFAGGSEFAAVQLWSVPPPLWTIVLVTFLINSRHIIMGAALAPHLQHLPKRKVLPALFFMADEGWAVSYADTLRRSLNTPHLRAFSFPYYLGACISIYPIWVGFSALGALVGPHLGNIETYGFAMAFPAVFLVLMRGMWRGIRAARPWLVSLLVASIVHLTVPGAWFVIAGALAGLCSAYFWALEE